MTDLTERLRKGRLVKASEPMNIGEHGIAWSGEVRELCHPDALEAATTLETLTQENARLREALAETLRVYAELAESGDAGFWDPEKEPQVIAARKALGGGNEG